MSGAEETIERVFDEDRRLRTRADVLNLFFFSWGRGIRWNQFGGLRVPNQTPEPTRFEEGAYAALMELSEPFRREEEAKRQPPGPVSDAGGPRRFDEIHGEWFCDRPPSAIMCVPDNVEWDWMGLAFEAAELLATRGHTSHDRRVGRRALQSLKQRFEIQE